MDGLCPACVAHAEDNRQKEQHDRALRQSLIEVLGGEKPYREFTFGGYEVTSGNRLAFEKARQFNPASDNLYLWGACGVGKTHLAYAIARAGFEQGHSVEILQPPQLVRKMRMKDPQEEQGIIDELVRAELFVLDDLGMGACTAYGRQILQEILDGRDFKVRAGLVITSKYALSGLAQKMGDDTIASRMAGMCQVIEIKGTDHRLGISGVVGGGPQ
jgi:DNA replication protein DnaC